MPEQIAPPVNETVDDDGFNVDADHCVVNGEGTYAAIAAALKVTGSMLVPWTDRHGVQFDIMFHIQHSPLYTRSTHLVQRGVRLSDLFVSIMSLGAFGFEITATGTDARSYGEKLLQRDVATPTTIALAELINGVKKTYLKIT